MIRLVTLDFWHTLFADTQDGLRRAHALRLEGVRAALAEAGHRYDAAELAAADVRAGEAFAAVWREHRDMAADEQLRVFLGALDPTLPGALGPAALERVARAYQEPALTHRPEITPGAAEAVHELRARGLALGVISNTGRTPGRVLRQLLADAGLLQHFASSPSPTRRGSASRRRRCSGGCWTTADRRPAGVHVGDDAVADVAGARDAGMRAIHFVPAAAQAAPADAVLRRFADLPDLVARLQSS